MSDLGERHESTARTVHSIDGVSESVITLRSLCLLTWIVVACSSASAEPLKLSAEIRPDQWIDVWPDGAPGEATASTGVALERRPSENPPATRIKDITRPRLACYRPAKPNGAAAVVLPGGGYSYVVVDKEGSEAARWLNSHGITAFVLHYRTRMSGEERSEAWRRPVADGMQAISLLRSRAAELNLDPARIGIVGFSAGGQAAAIVSYPSAEAVQLHPNGGKEEFLSAARPSFAVLVYPWNLVEDASASDLSLLPAVAVSKQAPPTILIHAHDDSSSSLGSIALYTSLYRAETSSELHVYRTGGHGYGMRAANHLGVADWTRVVQRWLNGQGISSTMDDR